MDNGNVTANNSPVIQWPMNLPVTSSQQWQVTSVNGNTYNIVSQKSGLALDNQNSAMSGFGLIESTLTGQSHYQWTITSTGNGYYKVISVPSDDALDDDNIAPGTKNTNTQVVQFTPNGGATQQWKLTKQ